MNRVLERFKNNQKIEEILNNIKNKITPITLLGLTDVTKICITSLINESLKKPICLVTYNEIQAKKLLKDIQVFTDKVVFFPKKEIVTYDYITESKDLLFERIEVLNQIYRNKNIIIVTTIEAVMQEIESKEVLYKNVLEFKVGKSVDLEVVKSAILGLGYERFELIEGRGQFSIRGDILDIGVSENRGIRIEFWGDEVDSIRFFNIASQRSFEDLKEISIFPAHEYILENSLEEVCKDIEKRKIKNAEVEIETILQGNYINKIDKYFSSFYEKKEILLDYLQEDFLIILDEAKRIEARANNILSDNKMVIKSLMDKEKIVPDAIRNMKSYDFIESKLLKKDLVFLEIQDVLSLENSNLKIEKDKNVGVVDYATQFERYNFKFREINFLRSNIEMLLEEIEAVLITKKTLVVLAGNDDSCKKLERLLNEKEILNYEIKGLDSLKEKRVNICNGVLSSGFEWYDENLVILTGTELFSNESKKKKRINSAFRDAEKVVFADLVINDYVVHKVHGIGQFIGVNTIKADGIIKDYIKIKYKNDDILYVPTTNLDTVRKYVGGGETAPKVNKLGGKDWSNLKGKVKSNLREVAQDLIELYAKRQKAKGYAFSKDTPWQNQFEEDFPYVETDDQLRCIEELKKDMEAQKPMDRLLCGDVGYGKTEVAIRGAFKACMEQKQVAYLVPTTVLASQQYETFKERMKEFPIRVELLNRFRTKKEQEEIIKKLKLGEIDIVVGTHRLLSKDVEYKDLGFLIIDEEHRFGVKDKEKIKEIKNNVDVLTMTATPIPRTLHMSIVGVRDMSVIYEPPQNRRPVQTYVLEHDNEVIREAITKELERGGQVFYLYNRVETIIKKAEEIEKLVPEAKVGFAHGKMTGSELEEIMEDFINKKLDILVCTTILESGIDIPNANTIIVENADRLGLAQLYQIRGRVGRSNVQAYAYITYKRDKLLSVEADKRLKAIKEFTEFGSGFKIAMRDLEIRGAGSLLGEIQHGHMEQVGYDTYCKLLDEVIKEMQGVEVVEEQEVQIDINVSSYIPDTYIESSAQKIEVYQNIALCRTEDDIANTIDEVMDRFGTMPEELENLFEIARIKELCKNKFVLKISEKPSTFVFYFDAKKFNMEIVDELIKNYRNRIKFSPGTIPYISLKIENNSDKSKLKEIKNFLRKYRKIRKMKRRLLCKL